MKPILKTLFVVLFMMIIVQSFGCTTLVVSGKVTADGRPLLWKLRDTEVLENKMIWSGEGKYAFIGMINSNDEEAENVWSGTNETGFSIMNSASFNVNLDKKSKRKDREGIFMRKALENCATLEDFEALLQEEKKPMGLAAHFGVIDANGGAAFYEVNNYTWTKFDANDAETAPEGYVLRTNYSFTGKENIGYGFVRFETAQQLVDEAIAENNLSHRTIIQDFSRCLRNVLTGEDYRKEYENIPFGNDFVTSGDLITRYGSSSGIVIQGVKKNEDPLLTTLWTTIGFPNTSIVMPLWCAGGKELLPLLTAPGTENSPLNSAAMELQDDCYPRNGMGSGYKYLKIGKLINKEGNGYIQQIESFEKEILSRAEEKRDQWSKNGYTQQDVQDFYTFLNLKGEAFYLNVYRNHVVKKETSPLIKAGVFDKNGDSPYCITDALEALRIDAEIDARIISAADIMSGAADDLDLILFPGGGGRSETGSLGEKGMEEVINMVTEKGIGVIGICAGAYILTKTPDYPSLGLSGGEAIDIEHDHRGHGLVKFALTEEGKKIFPELADREISYSQYYEGPVLIEASDSPYQYTELATMLSDVHLVEGTPANMTNNRPFIIVTENGNGMSASIVGHPESTPGMRWLIPRLARVVTNNKIVSYSELAVRPQIHTEEMLCTKEEAKLQREAYYNLTGTKEDKINAMRTIVERNAWSAKKWIPPMVRDNDPEVRQLAAELTVFIERTDAIPDFEAALLHEKNKKTKVVLEEALRKLKIIQGKK